MEFVSDVVWMVGCALLQGGLCVLGFFDASSDATAEHTAVLKAVAKKRAGQPFSFSWVDVTRQSDFTSLFEVRETDAPTVLVLSARKLRYAPLRGRFALEDVDALLQGVAAGRISTQMIQVRKQTLHNSIHQTDIREQNTLDRQTSDRQTSSDRKTYIRQTYIRRTDIHQTDIREYIRQTSDNINGIRVSPWTVSSKPVCPGPS
jgi:hypothetical protein